jgi:hypothetical protein
VGCAFVGKYIQNKMEQEDALVLSKNEKRNKD